MPRPRVISLFGLDTGKTPYALAGLTSDIENLGLYDVEPFKVETWKNRFNCSYFTARNEEYEKVFVKSGGPNGSSFREFRILQKLHREMPANFPKPLRYSTQGDVNLLAIGFVEGTRLDVAIEKGLYDADERRRIGGSLVGILRLLQRLDVIHRDFRPRNVIVDPELNPVLIDFEFALSLSEPKLLEYRQVKDDRKLVKNLGKEFRPGRYWWDDEVSVSKILAALGVDVSAVFDGAVSPKEDGRRLEWYGTRNTKLDRIWVRTYNLLRSNLVKRSKL